MDKNQETKPETLDEVPEIKLVEEKEKNEEITNLKSEIEQIKSVVNTLNMPKENFKSEKNRGDEKIQNGRMFLKAVIKHDASLLPAGYKADMGFMNETNNNEGLYTVPQEWHNQIMDNVNVSSVIRRNATILSTNAKEYLIPKADTIPSFSFVNEGSEKPVNSATFEQVKLTRHDGGFIVLMSRQLLEDSAFDIMSFVSNIAGKVIANIYDKAAFVGLSPINGLLDPATGATILRIGADPTAMTFNNLIEGIAAIPSQWLTNAKWVMHRTILALIKKMTATGSGEYIMSSDDRKTRMLEGFPVELSDQLPDATLTGVNKGLMIFGDLSNIFLAERNALTVSVSDQATVTMGESTINLWQRGLIGLNFGVSFDIKAVYPENLALFATNAS